MVIKKGEQWGAPGPLPADGVIARSDAEARAALMEARRSNQRPPVVGLLGGDLCRTLGGRGDEGRLRSADAMTFTVDVGEALIDGRMVVFVAHLVARNRFWTRVVAAMNAQFLGPQMDAAPRSHPNDGLLDVYDCVVRPGDLVKVRARLRHGAHLPYPGIKERRTGAIQIDLDKGLPVWADGELVAKGARRLSLRCEPDALTVVV